MATSAPICNCSNKPLATTDRPSTVATWLQRSVAPKILQSLAGQPLTHEVLDQLTPAKPVEHVRSVLVAIGALPARDEQLARLERWINTTLAERADPDEQYLFNRYGRWHQARRLRSRLGRNKTTKSGLQYWAQTGELHNPR